jgi:hypothetical protein
MLKIVASGKAVKTAHITLFERRVGVDLPRRYREFLLETNGGSPQPNYLLLVQSVWCRVRHFLDCWPDDGKRSVRRHAEFERLRREYATAIPVADLEYGFPDNPVDFVPTGVLCLETSGKNRGNVFYWRRFDIPESDESVQLTSVSMPFAAMLDAFVCPPSTIPWMPACDENRIDELRDWIASGADINARSSETGWAAIEYAASLSRTEMVQLLLDAGAAIQNALAIAVVNRHQETVALLIASAADASYAFWECVMAHQTEAARRLLSYDIRTDTLAASAKMLENLVDDDVLLDLINDRLKSRE